jgi:hypothetical protein
MMHCGLAGLFLASPICVKQFFSGHRTPVSKKPELALFAVFFPSCAPIESGHFARFSEKVRIGKPGVLRDFWGGYYLFGMGIPYIWEGLCRSCQL